MSTFFQYYIGFGTIYGLGRSYYYLKRVQDQSNTVKHELTTVTKVGFTYMNTNFCQFLWPLLATIDLHRYQKLKMGIKEKRPPFPFDFFEWKD